MIIKKIKIYLVDDHAMVRDGLKYILSSDEQFDVVGDCGDGRIAQDEIDRLGPDVVILDISMPSITGLETARQIRRYNKIIKIIILSRHNNEEYVREALKIPVNGYILKDNAGDDLIRAVRDVLKNNIYLSPEIMTSLINQIFIPSQAAYNIQEKGIYDTLSNREKEVIKLVAEGKSGSEIASLLRISQKTVKVHRLNIMNKLNIHNTADIVKYAVRNGLVEM
jgi:DNA-binding NarL/FixJ family response regulator